MKTNLTRKAFTGAAWIGGASVLRLVIRMLAVAILARLVTPTDFGILAASLIVVDFAIMLGQLGLNSAIIQQKELLDRHLATAFGVSIPLMCGLAIGIWYAAPLFSKLMAIEEIATITKFLTLMVVFRLFGGLAEAILARNLRSREIASTSIISWTIAAFLVAIPLALFGFGYWALVAMSIVEAGIWCALLTYFAWEKIQFPRIDSQSLSEMLPLGLGFAVLAPFSFLSMNADRVLVARLLSVSDLGLYSRSAFLAKTGATVFNGIIRTTVFPVMAQVQNDEVRLQKALNNGIGLTALLAIPTGLFCALFSVEIIAVLLGPNWGAATFPLATFGVSLYPLMGQSFIFGFFSSIGRPYSLIPIQVLYLAVLTVAIVTLYRFGLSIVCVGIAVAAFFRYFLLLSLTSKIAKINLTRIARLHWSPILTASGVLVCGLVTKILTENLPSWVTLGFGMATIVFFLLLAVRINPTLVLGREGVDLAVKVLGYRARYLGLSLD